jgi:outer membrane autotransporter protein
MLQPFVAYSLWHEFSGNTLTTFVPTGAAGDVTVSSSRIGTFSQVSVGIAGQLANSHFLGFVRGDARFGSSINGWAATAGLRYQF